MIMNLFDGKQRYLNPHDVGVTEGAKSCCFGSIKICPEFIGKKWNRFIERVLWSFNPKCIRLSTGELHCDSQMGRITVITDPQGIIKEISIEQRIPTGGEPMNWMEMKHKIADPESKTSFKVGEIAMYYAPYIPREISHQYRCTDCDAQFDNLHSDGRCGCGSGRVIDTRANK